MKCDHGLRRQAIVASLLTDVFQGGLRAGQHLVTRELATRFGVSHTPIREALIALAGIGVIDLLPNRGAVVRRVTPRDVREICQVRRVLECEAVRLACGRIDPNELATLKTGLQKQAEAANIASRGEFIEEARALDSRLHDRIAASCGNAFLAMELSRLKTLFRAFRDVAWAHDEARNDSRRLAEESHEHLVNVGVGTFDFRLCRPTEGQRRGDASTEVAEVVVTQIREIEHDLISLTEAHRGKVLEEVLALPCRRGRDVEVGDS